MFDGIRSAIHWRLAKKLRKSNPDKAAKHLLLAVKGSKADVSKARRAAGFLVADKKFSDARTFCRDRISAGDPSGFWRHYESFVDELESSYKRQEASPSIKIALFNDTDFRVNIGCRLTSQGLKNQILNAFPGAGITSLGFNFVAFREEFPTSLTLERYELSDVMSRLSVAYGNDAIEQIRAADFVILQPEGSLDHRTTAEGLATFFTPVLAAMKLGKPLAVLNGTIPIYDGERAAYLRRLFRDLGHVAARDQISAEYYGIEFLADAAFLRISPALVAERDGCLITTGARNNAEEDVHILKAALSACDRLNLRPVVLTHAVERFNDHEAEIIARGGIFAETASIERAAETISQCRLHIGGRYHMAIFSILCNIPSLLFDVKTHKNEWLERYSRLIKLVHPHTDLNAVAALTLNNGVAQEHRETGTADKYVHFLKGAHSRDERVYGG
ncbi:polysaccharide pyruvyl transferase family protein [Sinorhizobium numidicum]|uniref:Polysaccharide pyruvyl transferase family protein n=1 Tax=Sinorhizobium numidicum TaxID=680248 RepID=A0ABY8CVB3_9HYPH|nr:polysaccharide pyruvyl transferase family protein [Sinorhizobium numidicum]WEX75209.1 polysaccharide pyruvyl transferase family protein [Sinorhizobium numidicum]WEX81203.1 polysaccharide pyruvyl transferase family protein [Sinorhizobium numidicum]